MLLGGITIQKIVVGEHNQRGHGRPPGNKVFLPPFRKEV